MEQFWKGAIVPMKKYVTNAEYLDYAMNDDGEVWQLVDVTFGGVSHNGVPWPTGTYTYSIRQEDMDVNLDDYGGSPYQARDDLGYLDYGMGDYKEITTPGPDAYAF